MEITIIGLQNSGKTTLLNLLSDGDFISDTIPTVGFNFRKVIRGNVTLKCWDLGGQPRFRSMWDRYCRGVNAIVFVIDSSDHDKIATSATELHNLLSKPALDLIPLLVLANKRDVPKALTVDEVIEQIRLDSIKGREVSCYSISAKDNVNIEPIISWLVARAKR